MFSRLCSYGTAFGVLAMFATTLMAQEPVRPGAQAGARPDRPAWEWEVELLPPTDSVSPDASASTPSTTVTASIGLYNGIPRSGITVSENTPSVAPPSSGEPIASAVDDKLLDDAEVIELAPSHVMKYTSGMRDFWGYRYNKSSLDWIIGNQFGMFSMYNDHYQRAGIESGINPGIDINWVNGPTMTEMPPRLYDFSIAYQSRQDFGLFAYDVAASVMASSDFEGSAREGIRYPAHAVGFLRVNYSTQLVFGVDYLDRGDIKLLPVAGLIWIPRDDIRLELVFPRPRATFELSTTTDFECDDSEGNCIEKAIREYSATRLYIAGELGGGTWAVERGGMHDDLATYRDLRLNIGLENVNSNGSRSALEVSWLFARRLEFTSGNGNTSLDDTAMIRWIHSY